MTIVPIGNLSLQVPESGSREFILEIIEQLSTLNRRVLSLGDVEASFGHWGQGEAPPVVRVDGIWITVMFANGETRITRWPSSRYRSSRCPFFL